MKKKAAQESLSIEDRIYGDVEIESPVLIELVNSVPIQRLKRVNQLGIPDEFYHIKNFSRYEHCIGVMMLLRNLGASEEEQVAGLLHDVSHTAFSHLYDWVISDYTKHGNNEDSQDKGHVYFIRNSEIPNILESNGYSVDRITYYPHFGLLEREIPDLCADRIDYSLREFPLDLAKQIYHGLTVVRGQIVCKDFETADVFGRTFLSLQTGHWGGYEATTRYHQFASTLKRALELGIITEQDFLVDDEHIVSKLKVSGDRQILDTLEFLRQRVVPLTKEGIVVYKKFRYIDPLYIKRYGLVRLSETDTEFKQALEKARQENKQGVLVPA